MDPPTMPTDQCYIQDDVQDSISIVSVDAYKRTLINLPEHDHLLDPALRGTPSWFASEEGCIFTEDPVVSLEFERTNVEAPFEVDVFLNPKG